MDTQGLTNNRRSLFFFSRYADVKSETITDGHTVTTPTDGERDLTSVVNAAYKSYLTKLQTPGYNGEMRTIEDIIREQMNASQSSLKWEYAANRSEMDGILADRKP